MKCNIVKSKFYGQWCNKRQCSLHPCSSLITAHKMTLEEMVIWKHGVQQGKNRAVFTQKMGASKSEGKTDAA